METRLYQSTDQINGKAVHRTIDNQIYSGSAFLQSLEVYCEKYNLIGKIDLYDKRKKQLIERKKKIARIYDGYIFQLYAQYFSMIEMGYEVNALIIRSVDDNRSYYIDMPADSPVMFQKFEKTIQEINKFQLDGFQQQNREKCSRCIYSPFCDRCQNA